MAPVSLLAGEAGEAWVEVVEVGSVLVAVVMTVPPFVPLEVGQSVRTTRETRP